MKNQPCFIALALSAFYTLGLHFSTAHAQGTAFTYQGRLNSGTNAASGSYDLTFSLFNVGSGGSAVAGPLTNSATSVSNGLFLATLDFGGVFNGASYWLEIGVRTNGNGAFTTLVPRQAVTPTPYALYALLTGTASNLMTTALVQGQSLNIGVSNLLSGVNGTVAGGSGNIVSGDLGVVAGGAGNVASGILTAVGGGSNNLASGNVAMVGGGEGNQAMGDHAFVGGGYGNSALGPYNTVGGGNNNLADPVGSTVSGGMGNKATANYATVGGGQKNQATFAYATVGGGGYNQATGHHSTVGGGDDNQAPGYGSAIGGGEVNQATNDLSTVGGGNGNQAGGAQSTVGGGYGNNAHGVDSTVSGGAFNSAISSYSAIGGGQQNNAGGNFSVVPGGYGNTASADYSFACGLSANAYQPRSFLWNGYPNASGTFASDQFQVAATNGIGINCGNQRIDGGGQYWMNLGYIPSGSLIQTSVGASLTVAGVWQNASDKNRKTDFMEISRGQLLEKLAELPVSQWRYTNEMACVRHIGPTAQDFMLVFGLGTDDKSIGTVDESGVALAAIQGLNEKVEGRSQQAESQIEELKAENLELKQQNDSLTARLNDLEAAVKALAEKK